MKDALIIRFSSLGDIVLTTGVIKQIKDQQPDIHIDILTTTGYESLFTNYNYIRNIYTIDRKMKLIPFIFYLLKMPKYKYIFDFHSNLRSFIAKRFLKGKSYTYNKNAFARRIFVIFKIGKSFLQKHVVRRYYDTVVTPLDLNNDIDIEKLRPFLPRAKSTPRSDPQPIVTIHPFASKNTKVWPYYDYLIKILSDMDITINVIGIGDINLSPNINDYTGEKSYQAIIDIISNSDILVTNDSGPMHIAVALGINVIAIFGSTTKEFGFYPIFENSKILEYPTLRCRPCHVHGLKDCPRDDFSCMLSTTIEEVRFHISSMLSSRYV